MGRAEMKKQFLNGIDESITGSRIAGNPLKFLGDKVDLHGTVVNVLDGQTFNFSTGDLMAGDFAMIVVETDSNQAANLEAHQALRVLGITCKKRMRCPAMSTPSVRR